MEAVSAPAVTAASKGRRVAFRVVLALFIVAAFGFGLPFGVPALFAGPEKIHRFHDLTGMILLSLLLGVPGIAMWRSPERNIASHHVLLAAVLSIATAMAMSSKFDPFSLIILAFVVALIALSPVRDRVFAVGSPSAVLGALVVAAAVPLVAYALTHGEIQRTDHVSEHAEFGHWMGVAMLAVSIGLAGAVAALRAPGWRLVAWVAGLAGVLLGAGSLILEGAPSAVETSWAWVALAGGAVFILAAEFEHRRTAEPPSGRSA